MQYEKVPRKIPSVHCVTRSREKLTMMRGENCIDARVSVISRMANTIDTTVMMEAAMPARMTWATCGSACEGNRVEGTQALTAGYSSSNHDRRRQRNPAPARWSAGGSKSRHAGCTWRGEAPVAGSCSRLSPFKCSGSDRQRTKKKRTERHAIACPADCHARPGLRLRISQQEIGEARKPPLSLR